MFRSSLEWSLQLSERRTASFENFWKSGKYNLIPSETFNNSRVWLEIGSGTGWFIVELARQYPHIQMLAIERCKTRGRRLVSRTSKSGVKNLKSYKANAIPAVVNSVPDGTIERLYILYPCPWPKNCHRKNRWYFHPVMKQFLRILKPGGVLIWASDQKFYIDEARSACEALGLKVLEHGMLKPNPHNELEKFPQGRSKFEFTFLNQNLPCYELVVLKS